MHASLKQLFCLLNVAYIRSNARVFTRQPSYTINLVELRQNRKFVQDASWSSSKNDSRVQGLITSTVFSVVMDFRILKSSILSVFLWHISCYIKRVINALASWPAWHVSLPSVCIWLLLTVSLPPSPTHPYHLHLISNSLLLRNSRTLLRFISMKGHWSTLAKTPREISSHSSIKQRIVPRKPESLSLQETLIQIQSRSILKENEGKSTSTQTKLCKTEPQP